ncbi:NAD(P)/FAD-dependent oxidoreductase [Acidicapsa acidisoli]|uniref:NAD(P)/FAD-dependent oxidoreductase n=1 Tax=Acidicapsa acidisoli TaxID=1615681 RepID=UPI0021DFAD2D|nr:NAD(P)/FAD-dependent oxidoreductase [Acidicapsa acidisoli]
MRGLISNDVIKQRAIIIGAGPAGLTAALELLRRTGVQPVVLEATDAIGGISRTIQYKGNRMDIGGHRFFSKSDRVMQWWMDVMPLEPSLANGNGSAGAPASSIQLSYQGKQRELSASLTATSVADAPVDPDLVMLLRPRKSRIYFLRRFFDYPIRLTADTLLNLGLVRTFLAGISYMRAALFPKKEEKTLEDFLVNRFGRQLYRLFFESYTEKVWGVPCSQISAEWGAQRIKGLSLKGVVVHFLKKAFSGKSRKGAKNGIAQKETETSLIEQFLYPKFGPGQLWEHVAEMVQEAGGELHMGVNVDRLIVSGNRISGVEAISGAASGNPQRATFAADYVFSTMPIQELIRTLSVPAPEEVRAVSEGLVYRDFITVGLLASKLDVREKDGSPLKDNWIYIQEPDVQVGRLQIFNNWSPAMVADPSKVWIGLEYFCYQTDPIWNLSDEAMIALAKDEISRIGILRAENVLDAHVVRVPKTYPAYFGTYDRFDTIRNFTDSIENLFLVGRNGMHKYNNQDHSMLTAMTAVDNIAKGITDKSNLWTINTEMEYHEEKK